MNRIQKILERRRLEFAPPYRDVSRLRASLHRELPPPLEIHYSDTIRINNQHKA